MRQRGGSVDAIDRARLTQIAAPRILRYMLSLRQRSSLNRQTNNNLSNNDANYEMLNEF